MGAVAHIEREGVPMDVPLVRRLAECKSRITDRLIAVNKDIPVFEGSTFKTDKFEWWLAENGIPWPRLDTGQLNLTDQAFDDASKVYPAVGELRDVRFFRDKLKLGDFTIGDDGNNRCLLSPFRSVTGRNQPSNSRFVFGAASWMRNLILPKPGEAVASIDWSAQEFGTAAALSGDPAMMEAYTSGDPYFAFAKLAGAVPKDAERKDYEEVREKFKQCILGTQYGMGYRTLAGRISATTVEARELLWYHRHVFPVFWDWIENRINHALLGGEMGTSYGWVYHLAEGYQAPKKPGSPDGLNPRMMMNFPMQAHGADMLRLACILATERGLRVAAPVHDQILITSTIGKVESDAEELKLCMEDASALVLGGLRLRTETVIFKHPNHYRCKKGVAFWERIKQEMSYEE